MLFTPKGSWGRQSAQGGQQGWGGGFRDRASPHSWPALPVVVTQCRMNLGPYSYVPACTGLTHTLSTPCTHVHTHTHVPAEDPSPGQSPSPLTQAAGRTQNSPRHTSPGLGLAVQRQGEGHGVTFSPLRHPRHRPAPPATRPAVLAQSTPPLPTPHPLCWRPLPPSLAV